MASEPRLSATPAVPHLLYLDGLRGVTALFVVLHHVFAEVCPNADGAGLPRKIALLLHPLAFGHLAVGVFIVLSGFVLMLPVVLSPHGGWGRGGVGGFLLRRARRIMPPYYAALAASLLLIWGFSRQLGSVQNVRWDVALPAFTPPVLLSHVLLAHNFSTDWLFRINPPFWSIAVEWQIYFMFALLLLPLWQQTGYKGVWTVVFLLGAGPHFLLPPEMSGDWFCPWYLILFTMGMASASIAFGPQSPPNLSRQTVLRRRAKWVALLFALGTLATTSFGIARWYENLLPSDLFLGGATASFLVYAATFARTSGAQQSLPFLVRLLQSRAALALGAFSYSLYLVHFPLLSLIHAFLRPHFAPSPLGTLERLMVLYGVGVPLCLAVGYAFHLAFERPFLSKSKKPKSIGLKQSGAG